MNKLNAVKMMGHTQSQRVDQFTRSTVSIRTKGSKDEDSPLSFYQRVKAERTRRVGGVRMTNETSSQELVPMEGKRAITYQVTCLP